MTRKPTPGASADQTRRQAARTIGVKSAIGTARKMKEFAAERRRKTERPLTELRQRVRRAEDHDAERRARAPIRRLRCGSGRCAGRRSAFRCRALPPNEARHRGDARHRHDGDRRVGEPVVPLALGQHVLHRAERHREQCEARQVDRRRRGFVGSLSSMKSRIVANVPGTTLMSKHPVPRGVVDEKAAQRRPERRPHDRAEREDRLADPSCLGGTCRAGSPAPSRASRRRTHLARRARRSRIVKRLGERRTRPKRA